MADRRTGTLRGFGVLEAQWLPGMILEADSSYTEADPRPGSPMSTGTDARMVPQILGAQSAPVLIDGARAAGNPGLGEDGGAVSWRLQGEDSSLARHWLPPWRTTGCELLNSSDLIYDAAVCPLTGRVMVANETGTTVADSWKVYDPHTDSWTAIPRPIRPPILGTPNVPALVFVPGTSRCLAISPDGAIWYTDDYAATAWQLMSAFSAMIPDEYSRAAFDGVGNLLMLIKENAGVRVWGFVSESLGSSWPAGVSTTTPAWSRDPAKGGDIAAHPDGSIMYVEIDNADSVSVYKLGGAHTNPADVDPVVLDAVNNYSRAFIGVDDDGIVYVYGRDSGVGINSWRVWYSLDGGQTYTEGSDNAIQLHGDETTGDAFDQPRLVFSMGRGVLLCGEDRFNSGGFTTCCLFLGGWEGPCFEHQFANGIARGLYERFAFEDTVRDLTWASYATPLGLNGSGWAHNTITGTIAKVGGGTMNGVKFEVTAAAGIALASQTLTKSDDAIYAEFACAPDSDQAVDNRGIRFRGPEYDWAIRFRTSGFDVYDYEAGATAGAVVAFETSDANNLIDVRAYHDDAGEVTILYRERLLGTDQYHSKFTKVTRTITNGGARVNMEVYFGCFIAAASAVTQAIVFHYLNIRYNTFGTSTTYPVLNEGPASGWGKSMGSEHPYPLPEVSDTVLERVSKLRMRGGPVHAGDSYTHDVAHGYPVEAIFPTVEPSPERAWRSNGKPSPAAAINVAVDLQANGTSDTLPALSWSVVLAVRGANFRTLELASGSPGYTTLGTMDLAEGFTGLSYVFAGDLLIPDPTSGLDGARFIRAGELRGGHVILDPLGTPKLRTIRDNTSGFFGPGTGASRTIRPTLRLDGLDGTEAASGTVHIVWPSGYMVVHLTEATATPQRRWRIRIPSTEDSPDSYFKLGDVGLYGLLVPGKQWGHGREQRSAPNIRVISDDYGTQRRVQRGPNARNWTLTWDHGAKDDRVRGVTAADYLGPSSGGALAARDDVQGQLDYLLQISEGGARPVLVLKSVSDTSGYTETDSTLWLSAYLDGDVRHQEAAGRGGEGVDEFYRSGPINAVERL